MATNLFGGYSRGNPVRNVNLILVVVAALTVSGCADFAEREADRQVTALVTDRQDKTLGYRPELEAKTDPKNVKPTTQAYAKQLADADALIERTVRENMPRVAAHGSR